MQRFRLSQAERDALTLALAFVPLSHSLYDEEELDVLKLFMDKLAYRLDAGADTFTPDELSLLHEAATGALALLSQGTDYSLPGAYVDKLRPNFFVYNSIASRLQKLLPH